MAIKNFSSRAPPDARPPGPALIRSYPRELARVLGLPFSSVRKALGSLERDGLVAGRSFGRTRVFRLDPRYFAYDDLQRFLLRLGEPETELKARVSALRRRPRRTAKPL
jgi:sugar-specific transcriptional regulator TrmB